ncbi:dirp, partial [Cooperia oncophora]
NELRFHLILHVLGKSEFRTERPLTNDLFGTELQQSLRRIRNLLKLPKARRWVICEFFYSGVDEQLFLGDNEFGQLIREAFPNLKTMLMNKQEWRVVRRLLGKPRRCSSIFFEEERQILDQRRRKVRAIYDGSFTSTANCDLSDMPPNLPAPLVVGMKVFFSSPLCLSSRDCTTALGRHGSSRKA